MSRRKLRSNSFAIVLLLFFSGFAAKALDQTAILSLTVVDPTGAPIPGANISISGLPDKTATDRSGKAVLSLPPGAYEVAAAFPGFVTRVKHVDLGKSTAGAFRLDIASSCSSCLVVENPAVEISTSSPPIALLIPDPIITQPPAGSDTSGPSISITVIKEEPQTLSLSSFKTLPQKTLTFHNVHTKADETYTGVPLTDLLAKYAAPTGDKLRGKGLSDYIVATGSDGYKAVLSLAETDPSFHPGDVIVADTIDGKSIGDKDGPFKLVVTEDKRPARCVHNLVSIELKTAE